jgi:uncharacterized membrane protein YccC
VAGPAWLARRDPGLFKLRRAVRVATVASVGFYTCRYGLGNPQLAVYALFTAFALGALSKLPGPRRRRTATLLWSLPVAAGLVTLGSLAAVNLPVATAAMVVFGFLISFAGVGGPRAVGLSGGMQLMFILPDFPPYAPALLPSRLGGVAIAIGLLILAESWLWPDPPPVTVEERLAVACQALGALLAGDGTARRAEPAAAAGRAAVGIQPQNLPPLSRPASAGRRDRGLSHACAMLRYALAGTGRLLADPPPPAWTARLLDTAGQTATATAVALREGPLPQTAGLAGLIAEVQREQRREPRRPPSAYVHAVNLSLVISDAVWAMATAVRVARGGTIEGDHESGETIFRRFPYAYGGPIRRYWRQFAVHLTPQSVYFQQAVRVAVALGAGRLLAGVLHLQHGFWVLLATLTLLRTRAVDTRVALRPAAVGTIAGAVAAGGLLLLVGNNMTVYAALLPPVLVLALVAGSVGGLGWGQAAFTLAIALAFSQVAPATPALAEVRVGDVLLGAAIGMAAGLLAWPHGAGGELRRTTARLLASGGDLVRQTAGLLTAPAAGHPGSTADGPGPPAGAGDPARSVLAVEDRSAVDRTEDAMTLATASYNMYQGERHSRAESMVDWDAVLLAGHQILRGSELVRGGTPPGALAPWRDLVQTSAGRVARACGQVAGEISRRRTTPRVAPVDVPEAADSRLVEIHDWLAAIRDHLLQVGRAPEVRGRGVGSDESRMS